MDFTFAVISPNQLHAVYKRMRPRPTLVKWSMELISTNIHSLTHLSCVTVCCKPYILQKWLDLFADDCVCVRPEEINELLALCAEFDALNNNLIDAIVGNCFDDPDLAFLITPKLFQQFIAYPFYITLHFMAQLSRRTFMIPHAVMEILLCLIATGKVSVGEFYKTYQNCVSNKSSTWISQNIHWPPATLQYFISYGATVGTKPHVIFDQNKT